MASSATNRMNGFDWKLTVTLAKRFWPLWLAVLVCWIVGLVLPLGTAGDAVAQNGTVSPINWTLPLLAGLLGSLISATVAVLCTHEHLFKRPAAMFYGSLPLKREASFATFFCAGLVPLFAILVVVFLLLLVLAMGNPSIMAAGCLQWLGCTAAFTFIFYSVAELCVQVSGNRAIAMLLLVAAYEALPCIELAGRLIATSFLYGVEPSFALACNWLSPLNALVEHGIGGVSYLLYGESGASLHVGVVLAYLAVAVVLAALSMVLHKRRHVERAGESVVFAPLRPVLKYLAAVALALLFGLIAMLLAEVGIFGGSDATAPESVFVCVFMMVGGTLGVLFAEMAIARSSRVLRRCRVGIVAMLVASAAFIGACAADLFGVENYVPDATDVKSVALTVDVSADFTDEEAIAEVCEVHRDVLALPRQSAVLSRKTISVAYTLASGRTVERMYNVPFVYKGADGGKLFEETHELTSAERALWERVSTLLNSSAGIQARYADVFALAAGGPGLLSIEFNSLEQLAEPTDMVVIEDVKGAIGEETGYGEAASEDWQAWTRFADLSHEQSVAFAKQVLLPDLLEQAAGKYWIDGMPESANDSIGDICLRLRLDESDGHVVSNIVWFTVSPTFSPNLYAWVQSELLK